MADLYPDIGVGDVLTSLTEAETEILSLTAASAITKGDPVYLTADMQAAPATSAQNCIGIALKTVNAGEQCPVLMKGIVKVVAGGAISRGQAVYGADASKRILALTDQPVNEGGTATYTIYYARKLGIALQSFGAAGDAGLIYVCK